VADGDHPITLLLQRAQAGDAAARDTLAVRIYDELRAIAHRKLRGRGGARGLSTTDLAHEGYLRLLKQESSWQNRAHFYAIAATEMRRVLLDLARRETADKRGGGAVHLEFDEQFAPASPSVSLAELVSIDAALDALASEHPRQARVVELRAFGGLSVEETAEVIGISDTTVKRDWVAAIDWLSAHGKRQATEP